MRIDALYKIVLVFCMTVSTANAQINKSTEFLYNSCKSLIKNEFPEGYICRDFTRGYYTGFINGGIARKNPADRSRRNRVTFNVMLKEMGLCKFPKADSDLPGIFVKEVEKDPSLLSKPHNVVFFIVIERYGKCK